MKTSSNVVLHFGVGASIGMPDIIEEVHQDYMCKGDSLHSG